MQPITTPDRRLRVFVSSTLEELAPEREAVRAAIERLRLTPVMFGAGARPHSAREVYRAYLDQSDVFVAVYWERYGWVAPDEPRSGLHDEYERSTGLPRLIYLKAPAERRDVRLTAMLQEIKSEDSVSYRSFSTVEELQRLVEDDLAVLLTETFERSYGDDAARQGVPAPVSRLVGRGREIEAVSDLLAQSRLVTLTGPGGVGKSRLALEVGRRARNDFADQVTFVDLAVADRPEIVAATIAGALGLRGPSSETAEQRLHDFLRDRRMLIILDNLEQVPAVAPLLSDLLADAPSLHLLATSRVRLRARGEVIFAVPPLGVPARGATGPVSELGPYPAVELFVTRAREADPTFALVSGDDEVIAEITRRLDGLPLAIELAAARVRLLSVDAILVRLGDRLTSRLDLLTGGTVDAPERQRALTATIDWSYHLLPARERELLEDLSVFAGGFDLAAATAVSARDEDDALLDSIGTLVDSSLLGTHDVAGEQRFSFLATLRAFAADRLATTTRSADRHERHARYYLRVATDNEPLARGRRQLTWLRLLRTEYDNLRAGVEWSLTTGRPELASQIGWSIWMFLWLDGHIEDGAAWFERIVESRTEQSRSSLARAMSASGLMLFARGDADRGRRRLEQSLPVFRELGDQAGIALVAGSLGHVASDQGCDVDARALLDESIRLYRRLGDDWYEAMMLNLLGGVVRRDGDLDRSRTIFGQALSTARAVDDTLPMLLSLYNVASEASTEGDHDRARDLLVEGLTLAHRVGDAPTAASFLDGLGEVFGLAGDADRAVRLHAAADDVRRRHGSSWLNAYASLRFDQAASLDHLRTVLTADDFTEAWQAGGRDGLDGGVALARVPPRPRHRLSRSVGRVVARRRARRASPSGA